ncbi:lactose ABC transporter permease [Paenibacillus sp. J23TS9]|uniref:carbohydrate ABC transporter permease n=1 Tax=Paenibacillus sp. J23TS9 TaxID=2807193 RepID=UPI001B118947|nr:sugar ABC transporter permease [Paenibacillus sp. J23TS9]GIP28313.1 lactose ABC transporter permease [Paenibacillus sp. J23TS9]
MQNFYWRWQFKTAPYRFIAPFFILFMVFVFLPFVFSIYLSFTNWHGEEVKTFVGLANYKTLLTNREFWQSLLNSIFIFLLYVPVMLLLALIFASCLSSSWMKWTGFFRTVFFIPNITSVVAISFVFLLIFNSTGILNQVLMNAGFIHEPIPFLETPWWARISVSLLVIFRWTGYNMILLLGGMQSISRSLYEAAEVDGASGIKSFWYITLPLMKRLLAFCTVLSTLGTFSLFTEPFILTKGGPNLSTTTPVVLIYKESFQNLNMGYASTISIFFFMVMMILSLLQLRLFREND